MARQAHYAYQYMLAAAWRGKSSWFTLAAKHSSLLKPPTTTSTSTSSHSIPVVGRLGNTPNASSTLAAPLRRRVDAGGDAFFCTAERDTLALGVADGVSESVRHGGDPAEFSWRMMEMASDRFHELQQQRYTATATLLDSVVDARCMLEGAYDKMQLCEPPVLGSSTACLLTLCQSNGVLDSATLGDTGYVVLRDSRVLHRSAIQQHRFNYPYQLSLQRAGAGTRTIASLVGGPIQPRDAVANNHQLQEGDLVLLASDGLLDNLHEAEVVQVLETEPTVLTANDRSLRTGFEDALCRVAWRLVQRAWTLSRDPRRLSPWAQAARVHGAGYPVGGKPDDITLMLVLVLNP